MARPNPNTTNDQERLSVFDMQQFSGKRLADKVLADAAAISDIDSKAAVKASVNASEQMMAGAVKRLLGIARPAAERASSTVDKIKSFASPFGGVPIPLPVESVDIAKETTQGKVVAGIRDVAAKIMDIPVPTFPTTFHIDPADDVAKESSQQRVISGIADLNETFKLSLNPLNSISDQFGDTFEHLYGETKRQGGILLSVGAAIGTRVLEAAKNNIPYFDRITGAVATSTKPLISFAAQQTKHLRDLAIGFKKWFEYDMMNRLRTSAQDKVTGVKALALNVYDFLVPENSVMEKALKTIAASATFFGTIGGYLGGRALSALGSLGVSGMGSAGAGLARAASFLLGSATLMGGIVALATGAALYSLSQDPKKAGEYLEALGKLWNENITPTFDYIAHKVVAPLAQMLNDWWNSTGESAFLAIGDFINDTLIYVIGTAIPAALTTIGTAFTEVVGFLYNLGERVRGIFGFGDRAGDDFITNVTGIVTDFTSGLLNIVGGIVNGILRLFKLDDLTTYVDGYVDLMKDSLTNLGDRIKGFFGVGPYAELGFIGNVLGYFGDISAIATKALSEAANYLIEIFNVRSILGVEAGESIIESLKNKIATRVQSMIDGILSIIPSWEDIKGLIISAIPQGVWGRDWLVEKLRNDVGPTTINQLMQPSDPAIPATSTTQSPMSQVSKVYEDFTKAPSRNSTNVNVYAPSSTSTSSSVNVNGGGGGERARGIPSTRPQISTWDRAAYFAPGSFYFPGN